jgi:uncharacterized protein (TIGR02391 family)
MTPVPIAWENCLVDLQPTSLYGADHDTAMINTTMLLQAPSAEEVIFVLPAADAHHDRVIREACVILEDRVRKAIGAGKDVVGTSLMEQAFSPNKGPLRLSDHDQEQLGAMQTYRGVMAFFRNAAGHNLIEAYDQEEALRFVVLVDLLLATLSKVSERQEQSRT